MPEGSRTHMGGTMRLGLRPTVFTEGSENAKIRQLYGGAPKIWERHRHRYEVSPRYVKRLEESGFHFVGKDERGERMQIVELPSTCRTSRTSVRARSHIISFTIGHPYFVGLQAHPEFCSRPLNPSPPFLGFVAAACGAQELREQCERQSEFVPPHPVNSMIDESLIIEWQQRNGMRETAVSTKSEAQPAPVENGSASH